MSNMDEKIISMIHTSRQKEIELSNSSSIREQESNQHFKSENESLNKADVRQLLLSIGESSVPFHEASLLDHQINIHKPKLFRLMTEQEAAIKYPSERRPTLIYTNNNATINLTFNHTNSLLDYQEIEEFTQAMATILQANQPVRQWIGHGLYTAGEQQYGYCEFISPALNTDIYNLMFFASLQGKALVGGFNCIESDQTNWQPIAWAMLESLVVHEHVQGGKA
ncbi:hypothetical protein [Paenibacillus wulumuqiensis]|uniref:hypothetical protein n=1 Tax=Paenibacillus wulumuqiensis TaxID=1567107 RepID=UPI00061957EA|nr:hypothetical protein [Paenibacillus wulumuqiensis]